MLAYYDPSLFENNTFYDLMGSTLKSLNGIS